MLYRSLPLGIKPVPDLAFYEFDKHFHVFTLRSQLNRRMNRYKFLTNLVKWYDYVGSGIMHFLYFLKCSYSWYYFIGEMAMCLFYVMWLNIGQYFSLLLSFFPSMWRKTLLNQFFSLYIWNFKSLRMSWIQNGWKWKNECNSPFIHIKTPHFATFLLQKIKSLDPLFLSNLEKGNLLKAWRYKLITNTNYSRNEAFFVRKRTKSLTITT